MVQHGSQVSKRSDKEKKTLVQLFSARGAVIGGSVESADSTGSGLKSHSHRLKFLQKCIIEGFFELFIAFLCDVESLYSIGRSTKVTDFLLCITLLFLETEKFGLSPTPGNEPGSLG